MFNKILNAKYVHVLVGFWKEVILGEEVVST